jgi:branched-subunit amino acid transport protein
MSGTLAYWVVVFAVGTLNFLSRLSFIALFARVAMPPLVARALRFVPAAMLTAIIVPAIVFVAPGALALTPQNPRLAAALVAALVAWRAKSPTAAMVAGMVTLWGAQWALRAAGG